MLLTLPASIAVAPMRRLDEVIAATGARSIVSLVNAHLMPATPAGIAAQSHLRLAVSDARNERGSSDDSLREAVDRLVSFASDWQRDAPLLIHCFSGLNRSTAAAYIVLAALNPDIPEALAAYRLRAASDTAAPHRGLVGVADKILERQGKLLASVELIGPGAPAAEGRPFSIPAAFEPS